jgi:hypothetical protein
MDGGRETEREREILLTLLSICSDDEEEHRRWEQQQIRKALLYMNRAFAEP